MGAIQRRFFKKQADGSWTPNLTQPQQPQTAPTPSQTVQPGQKMMNMQTGETYNVVRQVPGKGTVVQNAQTNQQGIIPENQPNPNLVNVVTKQTLVDALAKQATDGTSKTSDLDKVLKGVLDEVLPDSERNIPAQELREAEQNFDSSLDDLEEIHRSPDEATIDEEQDEIADRLDMAEKDLEGPWDSDHEEQEINKLVDMSKRDINYLKDELPDTKPEQVQEERDEVLKNLSQAKEDAQEKEKKTSPAAAKIVDVLGVKSSWEQKKKELLAKQAADPYTVGYTNKRRVDEKLKKEAAYSAPDPRHIKDIHGHDPATNAPVRETRDIRIRLDNFPIGESEADSSGLPTDPTKQKGYRIPFREMDEKQVREREHFPNQDKLPLYNMKREEISQYLKNSNPERNYGIANSTEPHEEEAIKQEKNKFSTEELELREIIGISKVADKEESAEEEEGVKEGPIQFKVLQKAPPIKEYEEPALIGPAKDKVKEAITKLHNAQKELADIKAELAEKLRPLQEQSLEITKEYNPKIKSAEDSVASYLKMLYEQISETESKVVHYEDFIIARVERMTNPTKTPTLNEVIERAGQISKDLQSQIIEIKKKLQEENMSSVLERYLYKYPISKSHEKKITSSLSSADPVFSIISWLRGVIKNFLDINEMLDQELEEQDAF